MAPDEDMEGEERRRRRTLCK